MTVRQVIAVAVTIGLNALDGFDVLSISFASPGIAAEWGIDRAALGIVLSMELVGMALGSLALGNVADRVGRRPTILGCLVVMAVGMFLAPTAGGLVTLSAWRVLTGFGIGGLLAAINAVAAEASSARRRHLAVSLMAIGYPVGAVVGGLIAADLLAVYDWRSVFYLGGFATAAFVPLVLFLVPESVPWLVRRQPLGALARVNRALQQLGHAPVRSLPAVAGDTRRSSFAELFAPTWARTTVILTIAYFFHVTTFYFIVKWIPKIVVDMGFAASSAAGVLVWTNVGGATGGAVLGILSQRVDMKRLTVATMVGSTAMVALFGRSAPDLVQLSMICAVAGFFTNAGIVGLYAILAQAFPAHLRASGTGIAIGTGRGGSVLAPIVAGVLFTAGASLPVVSMLMATGSLVAAVALVGVRLRGASLREATG